MKLNVTTGGRRSLGVVGHGEFIDEIAVGEVVLDGPGITLGGQDFLFDSELIAEVAQLLLLGFEVGVVVVPENEVEGNEPRADVFGRVLTAEADRKSTRLNSSHRCISYAVFCLKKKKNIKSTITSAQLQQ